MYKLVLLILLCIYIISESCRRSKTVELNKESDFVNINVIVQTNNLLQIDSIYSGYEVIPLETKTECLINKIVKIRFIGDTIFIKDGSGRVLAFNSGGKYLFEIGKKGKGPGEYNISLDFDIDKYGNIYILDFKKILKYDQHGIFKSKFSFNFLSRADDKIYCNPQEFTLNENENFYIWGGSLGIKENPENTFYEIYEMTKEGKIVNKFFPLRYSTMGRIQNHKFIRYQNMTLVDPVFGSNRIFSINDQGAKERYVIDFGSKTLKMAVPEEFNSLADFKLKIDQLYCHSIECFNESNDWVFFRLIYKMRVYNVYYSKTLKKSFFSQVYPYVEGRISPWIVITCKDDNFVSYMEPDYLSEQIEKCRLSGMKNLTSGESKLIEKLRDIKPTDNPVIFICSMRKY